MILLIISFVAIIILLLVAARLDNAELKGHRKDFEKLIKKSNTYKEVHKKQNTYK